MTDKPVSKYVPIGTSGTDIAGRRFTEEYLEKLLDTQAADTWDEMRRSDDQVSMLLNVVKNPIMSGRWFIEPIDDSPEALEMADFLSFIIFEDMGTEKFPKTFEKFKREALTCLEFGYSLFEITNKIVFDHPRWGTYVGLKGLDWRSPRTIEEWYVDRFGILEKVRQIDNSENGGDFFIPGDFVLHISPNMEGDNFEGISALRPIYGNWLRKSIMRKIQMIGIERAATGVPVGVIPPGQENSTSATALEDSLSRFVSHERAFITIPKGFELDSLKISHDAEKVQSAIDAENIGMSKSFLANFMELGLSGSGSFALGTDLSDIFLSGIEIYVNSVLSPINSRLIPTLVKAKFGMQEIYPKMKVEGINDKAGKEFAEILNLLNVNGLLQVDNRLKSVIHKRYNLPEFQEEEENIQPTQPVEPITQIMDETEVQSVIFDKDRFDTGAALSWLREHGFKSDKEDETEGKLRYRQTNADQFDRLRTKNITQGVAFIVGFKNPGLEEQEDEREFDSEYKLDLAEINVPSLINSSGKGLAIFMSEGMAQRAAVLVASMMGVWRNTEKSKRIAEVNKLEVPGKSGYKKDVCNFLFKTAIQATKGVVSELGTEVFKFADNGVEEEFNNLPSETKVTMISICDLLVKSQDADLKKALFFTFTSNVNTLPSEAQMTASLNKVVDEYLVGPAIRTGAANAVSNSINLARNAIYQKPEVLDQIESFIFMNASPQAAICVELKGRIFTKEEYLTTSFLPPLHHQCDSWIKAQMKDKSGNKKLTPIGLSVTGTEKQIETKLRSKKF